MPMVKTTVRLEEEVFRAAKHRAIDERLSFQELIERAVIAYLKTPAGVEGKKHVRKPAKTRAGGSLPTQV
jgi:hypothetical protein